MTGANKCLFGGGKDCTKHRMYAFPGEKARFCSTHKQAGMVDVHNKRCEAVGCDKHPTYGLANGRARFCTKHKDPDMVDVHCRPCEFENCHKHPHYAFEGDKARFCATHKEPGMVDVKHKRCHTTGCREMRVYETPSKKSRFCMIHLEEWLTSKASRRAMASEKALAGEGGGNKRQTAKARQAAARKAAAQNAAAQNAAASLGGAIPPSASNLPQPQDSQYESKVYPMDFLNVPGLTPGAGDMDGDGAGRPVGIKRRSQSDVELRAASRMRGVGSDGQATSYPTHAPFEMEDAMPVPAMERIRSNPNPRGEGASATAAGGRSRGMRAVKQQPTRARAQSVPDAEAGDVIGDGGVMGSRMDSRGGGIAGERRDSMTASSPARANSMQDLSPSVLVSPRLAADRGGGDSGGGYGDGHPMEISPHPSEADSPYGRHTTRITPNGRSLDPMDVTGAPHDHHSQHHHGYPHHHAPLPTLRDLGTGAGSGNSGGGGSGASSGYRGFPESGGRTPPGGSRGEHGQGSSGGYSPARYVGDGSGPGGGGGASGGFSTPGHHRSGSGGGGGNGIGSFHAEVGMFHTSFSPIRVRRARGDSGSGSAGGPDVFRLGSPTKRGSSSSAGAGVGDGGVGGGHGQEGGGRSSAYGYQGEEDFGVPPPEASYPMPAKEVPSGKRGHRRGASFDPNTDWFSPHHILGAGAPSMGSGRVILQHVGNDSHGYAGGSFNANGSFGGNFLGNFPGGAGGHGRPHRRGQSSGSVDLDVLAPVLAELRSGGGSSMGGSTYPSLPHMRQQHGPPSPHEQQQPHHADQDPRQYSEDVQMQQPQHQRSHVRRYHHHEQQQQEEQQQQQQQPYFPPEPRHITNPPPPIRHNNPNPHPARHNVDPHFPRHNSNPHPTRFNTYPHPSRHNNLSPTTISHQNASSPSHHHRRLQPQHTRHHHHQHHHHHHQQQGSNDGDYQQDPSQAHRLSTQSQQQHAHDSSGAASGPTPQHTGGGQHPSSGNGNGNNNSSKSATLEVIADQGTPPHILSDDTGSASAPSPKRPPGAAGATTATSSLAVVAGNLGSNGSNGAEEAVSASSVSMVASGLNSGGDAAVPHHEGFHTSGGEEAGGDGGAQKGYAGGGGGVGSGGSGEAAAGRSGRDGEASAHGGTDSDLGYVNLYGDPSAEKQAHHRSWPPSPQGQSDAPVDSRGSAVDGPIPSSDASGGTLESGGDAATGDVDGSRGDKGGNIWIRHPTGLSAASRRAFLQPRC